MVASRALPLLLVFGTSVAHADEPPVPTPLWVTSVTATSTFADKANAYAPHLVLLPRVTYVEKTGETRQDSAWCEGKKDAGLNEKLTITLARPVKLDSISIKAGVWKTPALFTANNIPTEIKITTDDGRVFTAKPPAKREEVDVRIGGAAVTTLSFAITAVKAGRMNDSCITEISLDGAPLLVGFDAAAVAAFPQVAAELWGTLVKVPDGKGCDPKLLAKYVDYPFNYDILENTHGTNGTLHHPASFKTNAAFAASCKSSSFGEGFTDFADASISSGGLGLVDLGFETAETAPVMRLAWRGGKWRLATFK